MLFLLNRYVALLGNVYGLIGDTLPASVEVLYFVIQLTWHAHDSLYAEVQFWFLNICSFTYQILSCPTYILSRQVLVFLQGCIVCREWTLISRIRLTEFCLVILTLRTYALYGRSKWLLVSLVIIILTFMVGAAVRVYIACLNLGSSNCFQVETFGPYSSTVTNLPEGNCYQTYTAETYVIFFMVLRACSNVVAEPFVSELDIFEYSLIH